MHIMVHCNSCESYRLLKTELVGRDRFFELLSSTNFPLIAVHQSHCLYNDFHLDDLKTAV